MAGKLLQIYLGNSDKKVSLNLGGLLDIFFLKFPINRGMSESCLHKDERIYEKVNNK